MHNILVIASALLLSAAGCDYTNNPTNTTDTGSVSNQPTAKVSAVVVGMESSRFAGSCPGAKYDSDRMFKLISQYTSDVVLLQDADATRTAIVNAMKRGVNKAADGLFVFYYSGHGGSQPFPNLIYLFSILKRTYRKRRTEIIKLVGRRVVISTA